MSASREDANLSLVETAFRHWGEGTASFFDLLAEDAVWEIAGAHPPAGVYTGRDHYVAAVIDPLFARLAEPTVPEDVRIVALGDEVVVRWCQNTLLKSGTRYRNSYAWFLTITDGRIVRVMAFLDLASYADVVALEAAPA